MKLSELIRDYRKRENISQREFSRKCDLSNTYISFIENEKNPKTGQPLVPTLENYKKLADGMGMTVQQLFEMLDDDAPVDLLPKREFTIFVPSPKFVKMTSYMTQEDYENMVKAFENAHKRMQELGVSLDD